MGWPPIRLGPLPPRTEQRFARSHHCGNAASLQHVRRGVVAINADPGRRGIPDAVLGTGWQRDFRTVPGPADRPDLIAGSWKRHAARPVRGGLRAEAGPEAGKFLAPALPLLEHGFDEADIPHCFLQALLEVAGTGGKARDVEGPFLVSGLFKVEGCGRGWIGRDDNPVGEGCSWQELISSPGFSCYSPTQTSILHWGIQRFNTPQLRHRLAASLNTPMRLVAVQNALRERKPSGGFRVASGPVVFFGGFRSVEKETHKGPF